MDFYMTVLIIMEIHIEIRKGRMTIILKVHFGELKRGVIDLNMENILMMKPYVY